MRLTYTSLGHVQKASAADKAILFRFNQHLIDDAALLRRPAWRSIVGALPPFLDKGVTAAASRWALDDEASAVLARAEAAAPTKREAHQMFDSFVHDSLAGFNLNACELTGYWRYRKGFSGDNKRLIVENDSQTDVTSEPA